MSVYEIRTGQVTYGRVLQQCCFRCVIGAMAEFERELIQERVRAGLRSAQAKGKKLGRPRVEVDAAMIASLRAQGRSWAEIVNETGLLEGNSSTGVRSVAKIG